MKKLLIFAIASSLFWGCGSDDETPNNSNNVNNQNNASPGQTVYSSVVEGGNVFTCSACHAISSDDDTPRRPGHPIGGAPKRASFKNGQIPNFLGAVNSCLEDWMSAEPWTEDAQDFVALSQYLEDLGDDTLVTFEIVQPPADLAGDAEAGRTTFNSSCAGCHGQNGGGGALAPPIAGNNFSTEYVAERIRLSGLPSSPIYDGLTGGRMPFWSADRFSDEEVRNVATFISESEAVVVNNANNTNNQNNVNNGRQCDATHARVGATLELETKFHMVSGTATVIDDCTIEITNFNYDGTGIVVEVYSGVGNPPNYAGGQPLSGDLIKGGGYSGETITVKLPEDVTLTEVDGLSIWCSAVGISFGDGAF